jgi:hypothetical protein
MTAPDFAEQTLRAAAPDLFEALTALVEIDRRDHLGIDQRAGPAYREQCWVKARLALAKAMIGVPDKGTPA